MKWISVRALLLIIAGMMSGAACAAPKWYATLGVGGVLPEYNKVYRINNNSGFPAPMDQDIYTANRRNMVSLLAEIGQRLPQDSKIYDAIWIGIQYQHMLAKDIGKDITLYSDPTFKNYTYQLDVSANLLLLHSRVELLTWKKLSPFIDLSAGIIQFILSDYQENALPGVTARTSAAFRRRADLHFAYQLGTGVAYQYDQKTNVSLSYLYQYLGRAKTESGSSTWSDRQLYFGNAYAHSFFVTVSRFLDL